MTGVKFNPAQHVQLVSLQRLPYKQLSGYQKFHRVPETAGPSETRYLHELCIPELDAELESVFSKLRKEFGLKRKELSASPIEAGCGMIETPSFNFELQADLDPESPSTVVFSKVISNIQTPDELVGTAFGNTFGDQFRELRVIAPEPLSVEAVVDLLEDLESEYSSLDYDKDCTWCEVQFADSNALVRIDEETISVRSLDGGSPAVLFEIFLRVKKTLEEVLGFQAQA